MFYHFRQVIFIGSDFYKMDSILNRETVFLTFSIPKIIIKKEKIDSDNTGENSQ